MLSSDTVFISLATYCGTASFVLSKVKKGLNGPSVALRKDRAEPRMSSSRLPRILLALGDTFGNHNQRKQKFSWLLYHAVVDGISESHVVSVPLPRLLLHRGANPNFEVPVAGIASRRWAHAEEYTPCVIALAVAIRVSSDDYEDRYAGELWDRVIKLMLSFGALVNIAIVSQSVHMLGAENTARELIAVIGEDIVDRVLQALRMTQKKSHVFTISGYSLAGITKGII